MTRQHFLKTWPEFFEAIADGRKTFEVRRDDRGYAVGDVLVLQEYAPENFRGVYTGRELRKVVTYKMPGGKFGLAEAMCVLALAEVTA